MDFRIAGTFTDSLGRLTGQEQKAIGTAGGILLRDAEEGDHAQHGGGGACGHRR